MDAVSLEETFRKYQVDSVILCTSAVPKIKIWSLIKTIFLKLFGKVSRPEFYFPTQGDPYNVDWIGAKNQIDAAQKAGVKKFVFLSSMGGTQPENFLNTIGRVPGDSNSGNILLWKRKAEEYLINACSSSRMKYTIIHPGGLTDKKGGEGEILMGFDDEVGEHAFKKHSVESLVMFSPRLHSFYRRKSGPFPARTWPRSASRRSWSLRPRTKPLT